MVRNASEALDRCVELLNEILDFPLNTTLNEDVFPEETIENIRTIVVEANYSRMKKNVGVIGGSVAGIVGGGLSIAGAALIPFTFGVSTGLIVSGLAIALVGAGANIGMSIEMIIGDKDRVQRFKPYLEVFVDFNKKFAQAAVTIHQLLKFIGKHKKPNLSSTILNHDEVTHIRMMETEIRQLYESGENELELYKKFKLIDKCVKNIHGEIGELMKHWLSIQEIKKYPETEEQKNTRREEENEHNEEQSGTESFDLLVKAIPEPPIDESDITFRVFVRRYLGVDINVGSCSTSTGATIGGAGEATTKFTAGAAGVGARVVASTIDAADDITKVGVNVARIVKGISAASIVLSSLGIVVDVAFLGHAIYDIVKMKSNEDKRGAGEKVESNDFAEQLTDLAEIMNTINNICNVA